MSRSRETLERCLWVGGAVFVFIAIPRDLHAYLDPGTGSLLVQLAAAVVFGSLLAIKQSWQRITGLFRRGRSDRGQGEESRGL